MNEHGELTPRPQESLYADVGEQMARRRAVHYPDAEDRAFQLRMERKSRE
jgi:hypothetical protein